LDAMVIFPRFQAHQIVLPRQRVHYG